MTVRECIDLAAHWVVDAGAEEALEHLGFHDARQYRALFLGSPRVVHLVLSCDA